VLRRMTRLLTIRSARGLGLIALASMALAGCAAPSFPAGPGSATITWHSVRPSDGATASPPQPFAGTVAGIPVRGTSLGPSTPKGGPPTSLPARLTLATWTGSFEGHRFALDVSTGTSSLSNISTLTFDADGTFDSQKVRFIVGPDPDNSSTITFHGTVGAHDVAGSLRLWPAHGASGKATATFTVIN
jgi:hypothetical protein